MKMVSSFLLFRRHNSINRIVMLVFGVVCLLLLFHENGGVEGFLVGTTTIPTTTTPSSIIHNTDNRNIWVLRPPSSLILRSSSSSSSSRNSQDDDSGSIWKKKAAAEVKELFECLSIVGETLPLLLFPPAAAATATAAASSTTTTATTSAKDVGAVGATDIVDCCDALDKLLASNDNDDNEEDDEELLVVTKKVLDLRRRALEFRRYHLLARLLEQDYSAYVATASFLSPSRIPRKELPNVQDIPYAPGDDDAVVSASGAFPAVVNNNENNGMALLVADCDLPKMEYKGNLLDALLLKIFRGFVAEHTGGVTSEKPGMEGLLEQGRTFMLQPGQTPEAQHEMVYQTLKSLMTPFLPPFYRIFMSGIVPKKNIINTPWDGKQVGPWFYAPYLTSVVTPVFFAFLVGPSHPNRRRSDGGLGGLVVEKCRFLQESGCKGLCLHQCKLPAQAFFAQELGLPLTVTPNFVTQECQWSFGEVPVPPNQDPAFPKGCLVGCPSRTILQQQQQQQQQGSYNNSDATITTRNVDLCNYSM